MRRVVCVLASLLTLAACASAPPPRQAAALDPSNPDAPEAPPAALASAMSTQAAPMAPAQGHAGHGGMAADAGTATVYTCPMHPEVRSNEPGRCPKCGMKLVPVQPDAADAGQPSSGHDHGAHP